MQIRLVDVFDVLSNASVAEYCADPVSRRIRVKGPSLAPLSR